MKNIDIDDDLYQYIVKHTENIGESASSILRRLLSLETAISPYVTSSDMVTVEIAAQCSTVNSPTNIADILNYIEQERSTVQRGTVGLFLLILTALYRANPQTFDVVTEIRGRGRLYFAKNKLALVSSGSSTNPKQIAQSPYWVITNTNASRKKLMIIDVAQALGYTLIDAEQMSQLIPAAKKKTSKSKTLNSTITKTKVVTKAK